MSWFKSKERIYWVATGIVVSAVVAWLAVGKVGDNLVYYWSPSEIHGAGSRAYQAKVRLGGQVKCGSVSWTPDHKHLRFVVTDGQNDVRVLTDHLPPQMFREGIGVIVEGMLQRDGMFRGERMLVKHNNAYQAPKAGDHKSGPQKSVRELMKTVVTDPSASSTQRAPSTVPNGRNPCEQ